MNLGGERAQIAVQLDMCRNDVASLYVDFGGDELGLFGHQVNIERGIDVTRCIAFGKSGPNVRFGTKCASITSMCSQSTPLRSRDFYVAFEIHKSEHITDTEILFAIGFRD